MSQRSSEMDIGHLDEPSNAKPEPESNGKAIARANTPQAAFKQYFDERRASIEAAMAPHIKQVMNAERVVKLLGVAAMRTPDLMTCSRTSVLNAVMSAAQLGLDPSGINGECYLIPYKQQCQLILGYRGMVKLARRNPEIVAIESRCVYSCDSFEPVYGTDPYIRHVPGDEHGDKDSEITHVYAVARLANGERMFEVMTRAQVDRIKTGSSVWKQHYSEMARKTVTRRLCKHLPVADELHQALLIEDEPGAAHVFVPTPNGKQTPTPDTDMSAVEELEAE